MSGEITTIEVERKRLSRSDRVESPCMGGPTKFPILPIFLSLPPSRDQIMQNIERCEIPISIGKANFLKVQNVTAAFTGEYGASPRYARKNRPNQTQFLRRKPATRVVPNPSRGRGGIERGISIQDESAGLGCSPLPIQHLFFSLIDNNCEKMRVKASKLTRCSL